MTASTALDQEPTRFANLALGLDAALCNITGLVFTLTGAFMSDWLGVAGWVATVFGVAILFWSFVVTLFANRRVTRRRELDIVIGANIAFVLVAGSIALLTDWMSDSGRALLGVGAVVVAGFAVAQVLARRSLV